jgi:hypothetical protein
MKNTSNGMNYLLLNYILLKQTMVEIVFPIKMLLIEKLDICGRFRYILFA